MKHLLSLLLFPAAFLFPLSWTGKALLIKEARERGVPVWEIPSRCFSELTAEHAQIARLTAKYVGGTGVRLMLVSLTENTADRLSLIYGKRPFTRNDHDDREARERLLDTLKKYAVHYPQSAATDLRPNSAPGSGDDIDALLQDALEQVKALRDQGVISDEEYAAFEAQNNADDEAARARSEVARAAARSLSLAHCREEIRAAAGGKLDDETIDAIAREVEARARAKRAPDA